MRRPFGIGREAHDSNSLAVFQYLFNRLVTVDFHLTFAALPPDMRWRLHATARLFEFFWATPWGIALVIREDGYRKVTDVTDLPHISGAEPKYRLIPLALKYSYRTDALTACNSCNDRTLIAPLDSRAAIASTIACAPVIVVTQRTPYCKAARRIACSSTCGARP